MIDSASPPDLVLDLTTAGDHRFFKSISSVHAVVLETAKFKKLILKLTSEAPSDLNISANHRKAFKGRCMKKK